MKEILTEDRRIEIYAELNKVKKFRIESKEERIENYADGEVLIFVPPAVANREELEILLLETLEPFDSLAKDYIPEKADIDGYKVKYQYEKENNKLSLIVSLLYVYELFKEDTVSYEEELIKLGDD